MNTDVKWLMIAISLIGFQFLIPLPVHPVINTSLLIVLLVLLIMALRATQNELRSISTDQKVASRYVIRRSPIFAVLGLMLISYGMPIDMQGTFFGRAAHAVWAIDSYNGSLFLVSIFLILGTWIIFFYAIGIFLTRTGYENRAFGQQVEAMSVEESADLIRGMLVSKNSIKVSELVEITGRKRSFWVGRFYTLIGREQIYGDFDGETFIPGETQDIGEMIDQLLDQFEKMENKGTGKKHS